MSTPSTFLDLAVFLQMRHEIDLLLLELWQDMRCRGCIKQQASTAGGLFPDFVSAVLNDLMYLFKDSLERLADIKQIEDSKKDKKVCAFALILHSWGLTSGQTGGLRRLLHVEGGEERQGGGSGRGRLLYHIG
jgi:hypothetical protein